jgi:hypothetical protein
MALLNCFGVSALQKRSQKIAHQHLWNTFFEGTDRRDPLNVGWKEEPAFISTPATAVLTRLLPDATALRLEACDVDDTTAQITLRVQSTQTSAPCPLCATPARRIHSDYGRTLADLPWA